MTCGNDELNELALKPTILPDGTRRYTLSASVFPWALYSGIGIELENAFLPDGRAYPFAPALEVPLSATVRLHLISASAEKMHLHGYTWLG
jgi:hypothetical protein